MNVGRDVCEQRKRLMTRRPTVVREQQLKLSGSWCLRDKGVLPAGRLTKLGYESISVEHSLARRPRALVFIGFGFLHE